MEPHSQEPRPQEPRPRVARSAAAAAVALSLGVLGLFLRLQEYGPESAIRKFHQAAARGAWGDLRPVTVEDPNSPGVRALGAYVARITAGGRNRFRILRTDRTPSQVRAVVAYTLPPRGTRYMVWVVDRVGRSWRVSAEGTARVFEDVPGVGL